MSALNIRSGALASVGLFVGVVALYGSALTYTPPYLHEAEVLFALHAHAIATTGHDLYGRLLPLYFQMTPIGDNVWFHPAIVYATVPLLWILPFAEWVIRLPSALVAATNVLLIYFIAKRIFDRAWLAWLAAAWLALTPAHFVNSRIAMDYVYPLPFVLGWLLCLLTYQDQRQAKLLFIGGSLLGVGMYTYIASVVMMPFYLVLTWAVLYAIADRPMRPALLATVGFAWPLVVLPVWLYFHPAVFAETVNRYGGPPTDVLLNLRGQPLSVILAELRRPLRFASLTGRVSLYWYFFDPAYLFLAGGYANVVNSTRHVGVFLLPFLGLVPLGLWRVARDRRTLVKALLLVGFVSAPLAASLVVPEPYAIDREMEVVPFGVLLAIFGVAWLIDSKQRWGRGLAATLIVVSILHFAFFLFDYHTDYRGRSAFWFNKNHRGALETIIAETDRATVPAIYLTTTKDPYVESYWRFALIKHGKESLLARTRYFDRDAPDVTILAPGSLVLRIADDRRFDIAVAAGTLRQLAEIPEPADPSYFSILVR
jgi:4-amino-4-deoxy-L-arabinose transferase-like glycosyltransferase